MGDDAQAVVVEISEAIGSALDEFHFSVEAFSDAVIFGEAPHGDEGFLPILEGISQAHERVEGAVEEVFYEAQEVGDMVFTGACVLMLEAQKIPEFDHFLVEGKEGWVIVQEFA